MLKGDNGPWHPLTYWVEVELNRCLDIFGSDARVVLISAGERVVDEFQTGIWKSLSFHRSHYHGDGDGEKSKVERSLHVGWWELLRLAVRGFTLGL